MTEPDVTLTDYGLCVLCSWFAWKIWRQGSGDRFLQVLWAVFFASIALASLTGGTVHGFFLDESSLGHRLLWPATLLAIGVTVSCVWVLTGTFFSKTPANIKKWILFAVAVFTIYASAMTFYSRSFGIVIMNYLPAMIALLGAAFREYLRTHSKHFLLISVGILVSFVAAFFQQAHIGIHPDYFNHNSTYHLVQAFGLVILFRGASGWFKIERTSS